MVGDRAGLAPGMKVMGINGRLYSPQRLQDALADSVALRKIELLLIEGDRFRTIVLDYADGPKYLELVRDEAKPDVLAEILKPIAENWMNFLVMLGDLLSECPRQNPLGHSDRHSSRAPVAGAEADNDPFAACRFLIGEWVGEGSGRPGQGRGEFTFRPELQGKVLVRRHRAEIAAGPDRPAQVHEDLMVVYPAGKGQPLKATYWDNEGHTIQYTVHSSADGKTLTFVSEPSPARPGSA